MKNLTLIADGLSTALLALAVGQLLTPSPVPPPEPQPKPTTASMAPNATEPTSTESQQPEVADPQTEESTSAPEATEGHEAPSVELPPPDALSTYEDACRESVRTRELLVVVYRTEEERKQSLAYMQRRPALNRFVWLLLPIDSTVGEQTAGEFFGTEKPAVFRHDPVKQTSRLVRNESDLED